MVRLFLMIFFLIFPAMQVEVHRSPATPIDLSPLTPAERVKFENSSKVDDRIKIYESASKRLLGSAKALAEAQELTKIKDLLLSWSNLISASKEDIEKNINRKKKSRARILYEIHLRKAVGEVNNLRLAYPAVDDQYWQFWLDKAESARKSFVGILFNS